MNWNIDPEIVKVGPLALRYYSMMFVIGFISGEQYIKNIFQKRGLNTEIVSSLTVYVIAGTFIGARLGHCLFYSPGYYLSNPLDILKVWEGGLASHGGFLGVVISVILFFRKHKGLELWWLLDTLCAPALFTGSLIRIGNFFNSEIVGIPTDVPWGIVFERVDTLTRHPAQLYEAVGYFTVSVILYLMTKFKSDQWKAGSIISLAFMMAFTFRFFIEFFKDNQSTLSGGFAINMGQILSLAFITAGALMYRRFQKHGKVPFKS